MSDDLTEAIGEVLSRAQDFHSASRDMQAALLELQLSLTKLIAKLRERS